MTASVCAICARPLLFDMACFACAVRPHAFELPERIGTFPVVRAIGSGGMGSVYAGLQHCPAREVAIKVIKDGVFADAALRARFLREREIAGAFEHPNIIRVYDAGEDEDGQLYYVMELAKRGTLADFILQEPLSVREAVRLMIDVAFAVDYAHTSGVLHRDLKPENILIGEDRRPRVTDFGVARLLPDTSAEADAACASTLVGSYPYMAPEQAGFRDAAQPSAASEPSPASDVYSLGAILYELVHGAPPYAVRTREALLAAFRRPPLPALRGVRHGLDYDLEAVIMKALEHDRARRYASAAAFAEDLRRTLARRVPSARPRSLRGKLVSTLVHHAAWFTILVASLSISAGVVLSLNQAMLRASLREHANLRQQTTRTASAIARIFKQVAGVSRELAADPRSVQLLSGQPTPGQPTWLDQRVFDDDLISTAFLLTMDGAPAAHFPRERPEYYDMRFQRRVYFRGAKLAAQQGLGLPVFVSPLFQSNARDGLTKLAFSAPVYDAEHRQLGVAVATVALNKLTRQVGHPALALIAPREVELPEGPTTNVELVRVDDSATGQPVMQLASAAARQVYVENVARTDYAVVARVQDPPLGTVWYGLLSGVMALVCLCMLALFRRARADDVA